LVLFAEPDPSAPAEERIARPSVDELLDRAVKRRICVVVGAAGWGKTTAVATWSRSCSVAWVRYEDHEGDADRLVASLVEALQTHLSVPPPTEGTAASSQVGSSVAAICFWLRSYLSKDLVVVLDDLHGLRPDSDAAGVIETLCRRAPDRLHLILISRCELPFSVQRLRGRGLVMEIHAPDLAFDVADVEALLGKTVGQAPAGLARRVWEFTSGWPAAVHCAVEMLRIVAVDRRVRAVEQLSRPGEWFHHYLAEEVINAAPDWIQQLLRRLAIFGEVRSTTEIARGLNDPTTVLAELSRQGLVQRSGRDSTSWSLVRPLCDYFEHEAAPSGSDRKTLLVTAAGECIDRGAPGEALRHLLAAGEYAECASLLVDHGGALVQSGQAEVVLEAAELPAEYLDDPRIQQVLGQAQQVRGQWAQAMQHYRRASDNCDELEPALSWRLGMLAFAQGEFAEVHALTERTRLDREDTLDETRVLSLAASAHRMTGDMVNMQKMARQTRGAARRCDDPRAWTTVHNMFTLLAAAEGDWRQANSHCAEALRTAEATGDLLQLTWTRTSRAFHYFEAGSPRHALAEAEIALDLSERCEDPFFTAHCLTTRGRARSRLGMLDTAAVDFSTAIELFQRIGSRFLAWPLCGMGDLHRTRGQLVRAQAVYEEALSIAEPCHDVFGLSSALIGLARIGATDDLELARDFAARAVALGEGLRKIPAFLARGWVELMGCDRQRASADAARAAAVARQRRDNPGLAEAITLSVLAANEPAVDAAPLREAIDIWQETGCRLEEAATRVVAAHIGAPNLRIGADVADQMLRDHGVGVESRRVAGPLGVLAHFTPMVSVHTLGAFRVIRDGVPVPTLEWKSKKARDLLKILVSRRGPIHRDQLMELLWPEVAPAVAGNRLSVLLSALRDVLLTPSAGEGPLLTTNSSVSLNRALVSVDVDDFLDRASAALDADRATEPDVIARLEAAVAAHTGRFLEEDSYQEWAGALAEEVRANYIALLRSLAARLREAGDADAAVRYTLRVLQQDCYDEAAHLDLVGILREAGRLGEARRHYESYVRRMAEIGVSPRPLPEITSRG
jgi:DNA-binding SARP family transcriptional activator/tetratricopeptide (TPR) repeat protein